MRAPWVAAGATLVTLGGLAAPALLRGAWLGNGTADVWGHAWGYAWTARALGAGGWPLVAPLDGGQPWWLVDPAVALVAAPLAAAFGPRLAWDVVQLALPALVAASFADALGRWRGGDPAGRAAFGWALGVSPFVRGLIASGVPEGHALLFLPWLVAAATTGVAPVLVALAAAAIAVCGPYAPVAGAGVAAAMLLARIPIGQGVVAAAIGGALGAGIQLGGLLWSDHPALGAGGGGGLSPGSTWAWAARGGADLANFLSPRLILPAPEPATLHRHVAWVGLMGLGAAVLATRRGRAPRGLLSFAAVVAVIALGDRLRVGGIDTGLPLPAAAVPGLGANAYRLAGLSVAAALAAAWAGADRRAVLLAGLITVEGLAFAPVEVWIPGAPNPPPIADTFLAANPGPVLDLPLDREGRLPKGPCPQRGLAHQAAHGQPIASALYRAPAVLRIGPVAAMDEAVARAARADRTWARPRNPPPVADLVPGAPFPANASEREALAALGYRWVSLDAACVPPAARGSIRATLDRWLGPPVVIDGEGGVWSIGG